MSVEIEDMIDEILAFVYEEAEKWEAMIAYTAMHEATIDGRRLMPADCRAHAKEARMIAATIVEMMDQEGKG